MDSLPLKGSYTIALFSLTMDKSLELGEEVGGGREMGGREWGDGGGGV